MAKINILTLLAFRLLSRLFRKGNLLGCGALLIVLSTNTFGENICDEWFEKGTEGNGYRERAETYMDKTYVVCEGYPREIKQHGGDVEVVSYLEGNVSFSSVNDDWFRLSISESIPSSVPFVRVNAKFMVDRSDLESYRMDALLSSPKKPHFWRTTTFLKSQNADHVNLGVQGITNGAEGDVHVPICVTESQQSIDRCSDSVVLTMRINVRSAKKVMFSTPQGNKTARVIFPTEKQKYLEANVLGQSFVEIPRNLLIRMGFESGKSKDLNWLLLGSEPLDEEEAHDYFDEYSKTSAKIFLP